jgi:hypothetical protein
MARRRYIVPMNVTNRTIIRVWADSEVEAAEQAVDIAGKWANVVEVDPVLDEVEEVDDA